MLYYCYAMLLCYASLPLTSDSGKRTSVFFGEFNIKIN